jgi:hypothetical protein
MHCVYAAASVWSHSILSPLQACYVRTLFISFLHSLHHRCFSMSPSGPGKTNDALCAQMSCLCTYRDRINHERRLATERRQGSSPEPVADPCTSVSPIAATAQDSSHTTRAMRNPSIRGQKAGNILLAPAPSDLEHTMFRGCSTPLQFCTAQHNSTIKASQIPFYTVLFGCFRFLNLQHGYFASCSGFWTSFIFF